MRSALLLALLALAAPTLAHASPLEDGELAIRQGEYDAALKTGQAALDAGGKPDEQLRAHRVIGLALVGLADAKGGDAANYQQAVEHLTPYWSEHKKELFVAAKLGEARVQLGQNEQGLALLEPLLKDMAIPDVHVWRALAKAKQATGDAKGARVAAMACLRLDPADAGCKAVSDALGPAPKKKGK